VFDVALLDESSCQEFELGRVISDGGASESDATSKSGERKGKHQHATSLHSLTGIIAVKSNKLHQTNQHVSLN
jgi:hypothetical protein